MVELADFVGSTSGIINFAVEGNADTYIIATEQGVLHPLQMKAPEKSFVLASSKLVCRNMKVTTLQDLHQCLVKNRTVITLDETIREHAYKSLDKMLEMSR